MQKGPTFSYGLKDINKVEHSGVVRLVWGRCYSCMDAKMIARVDDKHKGLIISCMGCGWCHWRRQSSVISITSHYRLQTHVENVANSLFVRSCLSRILWVEILPQLIKCKSCCIDTCYNVGFYADVTSLNSIMDTKVSPLPADLCRLPSTKNSIETYGRLSRGDC